jgi:hypothetical protein
MSDGGVGRLACASNGARGVRWWTLASIGVEPLAAFVVIAWPESVASSGIFE